jgi:hypothetical protein
LDEEKGGRVVRRNDADEQCVGCERRIPDQEGLFARYGESRILSPAFGEEVVIAVTLRGGEVK